MSKNLVQKNIPKGWSLKTLGDVSKVGAGFGFPLRFQGKKDGEYPFAKVSDMNLVGNEKYLYRAENYLNSEDLKKVKVKTFPIGTTVFPKVGAALLTNKRRLLKVEAIVDNNVMGLIPLNISSEFLYYWMLNFDITQHVANGALPSINQSYVEKIELLLPTNSEQQKIAEILSIVDEEIQKVNMILSKTVRLKDALMQQLFTKGIGHNKFKKTKIGNLPEDWRVVSLGEIGTNIIGLTYSPKDVVSEGGTLVLRSSNILGNSLKYEDKVFVNKDIPEHLITKNGDILLCTRNGSRNLIGKNAYIDEKSAGHSFGAFMSVYRTQYSKFVFQLFQSKFFKEQINQYLGATINQITTKSLNSFIFPLPPVDEQEKITDILFTIDQKISVGKSLKAKLVLLKKGLLADLLNGKVRVNAD